MEKKANILVLGTSGAGKSTLINTVIGRNAAEVGVGNHVTERAESYVSEELNFNLIDSRGFEYNYWNTRKTVKDMRNWIRQGMKEEEHRIHMLWFCVDTQVKRLSKQTIQTIEEIKKIWPDIPMIVVLTKSYFEAEDKENIEMAKNIILKTAKKTGEPIAYIPVLAQAPKGMDIPPRGIDILIQTTQNHLDKAVACSEEAAKNYVLKMKRLHVQVLTIGAALSASVVGAVPIPIPDAALLTPLEAALISKITKVYNVGQTDEKMKHITSRIVEAGTVGLVAKTAINQLKLVPGLMNLAADILNAIVAGVIVLTIGEAASIIMEKVYLGEYDESNLDWIDKVVESSMGDTIARVISVLAKQNGKIDIKEILKAAADKSAPHNETK